MATKITPGSIDEEPREIEPVPLSAEQVRQLRLTQSFVSPWMLVLIQVLVGIVLTAVTWGLTGRENVTWSVACGALAVVAPAALFARGVTGRFASANAGSAVVSFFVWELVKIVMTVAVMFTAYRVVENLSWPAMLAGLVVTMKVYWVALRFGRKPLPVQNVTLNGKSN